MTAAVEAAAFCGDEECGEPLVDGLCEECGWTEAVEEPPPAKRKDDEPEDYGPERFATHAEALEAWLTRPCHVCEKPMSKGVCSVKKHRGYVTPYEPDDDWWKDSGPDGDSRYIDVIRLPDGQLFDFGGARQRFSVSGDIGGLARDRGRGILRTNEWHALSTAERDEDGCGLRVHLHTATRPDGPPHPGDSHRSFGGYFGSVWCECGWGLSTFESHLHDRSRRAMYDHALGRAWRETNVWKVPPYSDSTDKWWKRIQAESADLPEGWPILVLSEGCQKIGAMDRREGVDTDHGCWAGAGHHGDRYTMCMCGCHDDPSRRPRRCGNGYHGGAVGEGGCLKVAVAPQPPRADGYIPYPELARNGTLTHCAEHWNKGRIKAALTLELDGLDDRNAVSPFYGRGPVADLFAWDIVREPDRVRRGWHRSDLDRFVWSAIRRDFEQALGERSHALVIERPDWLDEAADALVGVKPKVAKKAVDPMPVDMGEQESLF